VILTKIKNGRVFRASYSAYSLQELQRLQNPRQQRIVTFALASILLLRLSYEGIFVAGAAYAAYLFRHPAVAQAAVIRVASHFSYILQTIVLYLFPCVCWAYGAGTVFSTLVSALFWGSPAVLLFEAACERAVAVLPCHMWQPSAAVLARMGAQCPICWGALPELLEPATDGRVVDSGSGRLAEVSKSDGADANGGEVQNAEGENGCSVSTQASTACEMHESASEGIASVPVPLTALLQGAGLNPGAPLSDVLPVGNVQQELDKGAELARHESGHGDFSFATVQRAGDAQGSQKLHALPEATMQNRSPAAKPASTLEPIGTQPKSSSARGKPPAPGAVNPLLFSEDIPTLSNAPQIRGFFCVGFFNIAT
jgi:hypothetical protein